MVPRLVGTTLYLLYLIAGISQGAGADESCPAGSGPGCSGPASKKCVKWRQTGGCSPKGPRENHGDKSCDAVIEIGASGYCQCGSGSEKVRARAVSCDHRPITCATECLQAERYTCLGWKQTGGCSADGAREPANDKSCDATIHPGSSGYCECGGGRIVKKPGCAAGEWSESFTCADECSAEADLYEELGLDNGASDKDIKQAFRKLSLKYHPDKTRNDPVMTARFAAIREAYDIIGEPEKRGIYDAAGLRMLYDSSANKVEKGPTQHLEVPVTLEQMYNGQEMTTAITRTLVCRGCADVQSERCRKCTHRCADEIEIRHVQVQGMGNMMMQQQVQVPSRQKCRRQQNSLLVTIEPGMSAGDSIQFKAMGDMEPNKIPGDAIIKLKESKHNVFTRVGTNLQTEIELSLSEALLGFERSITHLDGRKINLAYSGVTKPFAVMRVKGEGMPHRGDPTEKGDLLVKCRLVMPEDGKQWLRDMQAKHGNA